MKKPQSMILVLIIGMFFLFLPSCSSGNKTGTEDVKEAFRLRMNGKCDQAKALLEGILLKDSSNAMAWYELARLQNYLIIGGGNVKIAEMVASVDNALSHDPKNVIYAYYKSIASFMEAFFEMEKGNNKLKPFVRKACADFERVLGIKPDYYEAMLYLVEFYGVLPVDMGGDSLKAADYAAKLEKKSKYFGAKAKAVLLPENADRISYWKKILADDPTNPGLMAELGKALLFRDDPQQAGKYFEEAIKADPSKNILVLDLARYHIMKVMENKDVANTELPVAKELLQKYLKTSPEPVVPLKAYAMGLIVRVDMMLGNQLQAEKLMEETRALDPYFSRASGVPLLLLFDPPDQVVHQYFSFFSPF